METRTAIDIVNSGGFVYKPGYEFHAEDYTWRMQGAILLTISMVTQSTDREDARNGYQKMLEPLHTTFPIIVKNCVSEDDFLYEVLKVIIELETHEAREFLRKRPTYSAPFHPHRIDSMERYSRYSGHHVSDDLNYGSYAPRPHPHAETQHVNHTDLKAVGTDAPRTVDNDERTATTHVFNQSAPVGVPRTVDS